MNSVEVCKFYLVWAISEWSSLFTCCRNGIEMWNSSWHAIELIF